VFEDESMSTPESRSITRITNPQAEKEVELQSGKKLKSEDEVNGHQLPEVTPHANRKKPYVHPREF